MLGIGILLAIGAAPRRSPSAAGVSPSLPNPFEIKTALLFAVLFVVLTS